MIDVEPVIRRPVPIQHVAVRALSIPAPLDFLPQPRRRPAYLALDGVVAIEVLPGREQPLNHERRFDEIAAVVVLAEVRYGATRIAVEKMRPHAVKAIRALQESH